MAHSLAQADEVWTEFHRVVNLTSRELADRLRTGPADPEDEALPDESGSATGRHVVRILGTRRTDPKRSSPHPDSVTIGG